ncbi:uncharacterized protein B0J16DRAFT_323631 [Fusarium flagelliforme]|uniref:uncharacterized protein n=1 Tax=Fusarium flagelliforme TaxID=2675880 RepID=UPI001E8DB57E|nr:uncharacterized protein B0J16DRAFT_323631 [Fusarium flagelliforme]KAH7174164.1 hypothetical protein B0J16DRAFT_323631 [Fusarium flagelliforme]
MTNNTGYLLAIGGVGMLQNVVVVGWRRNPRALGVHLDFKEVVGDMTAMDALLRLEAKCPSAGRSLLPILLPGELLPAEIEKWRELSATSGSLPGGANTTSSTDMTSINLVPESWAARIRALGSL